MTLHTRRATIGLMAGALATPAFSYDTLFLDGIGVALRGYDPVAYFTYEEATKGSVDIALETDEGTWWFAEEKNRDLFRADPGTYTPQFGGFDAEGMTRGFKRVSDPTVWVMIDRKVYLHYSIPDQNRWAKDVRGNIRKGEENWERIREF